LPPIRLQSLTVAAERIAEQSTELLRVVAGHELLEPHDQRRVTDDADLAVDAAGELGERLEAVLASGLGEVLREAF
jgi:hypothetical protein